MTERSKVPVLKTGVLNKYRGFESYFTYRYMFSRKHLKLKISAFSHSMSTAFPHSKPLYSKINLFNLAINKIIRAKGKSLTKVPSRSMGTAVPLPKETLRECLELLATTINKGVAKGERTIRFPFSRNLDKTITVLARNGLIDEYEITSIPPYDFVITFTRLNVSDKHYVLNVSVLDTLPLSSFLLEDAMRECDIPNKSVCHSGETELYLVVKTTNGVHILSTKSVTRAFWYPKNYGETTPL
jgi:hypothetical protein